MIIQNAIQTPDGTILLSSSTHDYQEHKDRKNNNTYVVDGGREYLRRAVQAGNYVDLTLTTNSRWRDIKRKLAWGVFVKNGTLPYDFRFIKDLSLDHLKAILDNMKSGIQPKISFLHLKVIEYWYLRKLVAEE